MAEDSNLNIGGSEKISNFQFLETGRMLISKII